MKFAIITSLLLTACGGALEAPPGAAPDASDDVVEVDVVDASSVDAADAADAANAKPYADAAPDPRCKDDASLDGCTASTSPWCCIAGSTLEYNLCDPALTRSCLNSGRECGPSCR